MRTFNHNFEISTEILAIYFIKYRNKVKFFVLFCSKILRKLTYWMSEAHICFDRAKNIDINVIVAASFSMALVLMFFARTKQMSSFDIQYVLFWWHRSHFDHSISISSAQMKREINSRRACKETANKSPWVDANVCDYDLRVAHMHVSIAQCAC